MTGYRRSEHGEKLGNERFYDQDEKRLAKAQRRLVRTCKASRSRVKVRRKVPRTRIIRGRQAVCAENLHLKGMLAHLALAQSIADVGFQLLTN